MRELVESKSELVAEHTKSRLDVESRAWETGIALKGLIAQGMYEKEVKASADHAVSSQTSEGLLAYGWGDYPKEWMKNVDENMSSYKPTVNTSILAHSVIDMYEQTDDETYLRALDSLYDYYQKCSRTADGGIIRRLDEREIFTETPYFLNYFLIKYAKIIDDDSPIEEAVKQLYVNIEHLQDDSTGLYRHIWRELPNSYPLSSFWSRANGWAIAALLDTLLLLPQDHQARPDFEDSLKRNLETLIEYQDRSGFWHLVIDDPQSSLEASGTLIAAYTIQKSLNNGIIEGEDYEQSAENAMKGCLNVVDDSGAVLRVSKPPASAQSPLGSTLYGQGWFLLAANCFL